MNSPKTYEILNWLRHMKLMSICHLMCFNCKEQGEMLSLRFFTAIANQKMGVLVIPVSSPLCSVLFMFQANSWFFKSVSIQVNSLSVTFFWETIDFIFHHDDLLSKMSLKLYSFKNNARIVF